MIGTFSEPVINTEARCSVTRRKPQCCIIMTAWADSRESAAAKMRCGHMSTFSLLQWTMDIYILRLWSSSSHIYTFHCLLTSVIWNKTLTNHNYLLLSFLSLIVWFQKSIRFNQTRQEKKSHLLETGIVERFQSKESWIIVLKGELRWTCADLKKTKNCMKLYVPLEGAVTGTWVYVGLKTTYLKMTKHESGDGKELLRPLETAPCICFLQ